MSGLESSSEHIRSSCDASSTSSSTMRPTWTCDTPSKPSAGSARSTAWPCGSRIPSFGLISTRALVTIAVACRRPRASTCWRKPSPLRPWPAQLSCPAASSLARRSRPLQPRVERLAGDALVGLAVEGAGALDHVVGEGRRGRRLVPARARCPVAHVLLVEGGLARSGRVAVSRPEARRVGREHLVAHHDPARLRVTAELELRVGEDDPALAGVLCGELVEVDRDPPQLLESGAVAEDLRGAVEVDV